jgi:hypothetical protein
MNIENFIAAFLPSESARRIVRVIEIARDALVPDRPPPPGCRRVDMIGAKRDPDEAEKLNVADAACSAVTDEPAAPQVEKPRGGPQRLVELAPGSRALQLDCCAYGGRFARREGRGHFARTDYDPFDYT